MWRVIVELLGDFLRRNVIRRVSMCCLGEITEILKGAVWFTCRSRSIRGQSCGWSNLDSFHCQSPPAGRPRADHTWGQMLAVPWTCPAERQTERQWLSSSIRIQMCSVSRYWMWQTFSNLRHNECMFNIFILWRQINWQISPQIYIYIYIYIVFLKINVKM